MMNSIEKVYNDVILENKLTCQEFKKGQYVYREGDPIDGIFLIQSGSVFIINDNFVLWTAEQNELFGISSYMSDSDEYKFSARVNEPAKVYKITLKDVENIIRQNPAFAQLIIQTLCQKIELIDAKTRSFMWKSSKNRLIEALIDKSRSANSKNLPFQIGEFSELVGVSTRRIKSMLKELEDKKLVRKIKNELEILDLRGLEIINGGL